MSHEFPASPDTKSDAALAPLQPLQYAAPDSSAQAQAQPQPQLVYTPVPVPTFEPAAHSAATVAPEPQPPISILDASASASSSSSSAAAAPAPSSSSSAAAAPYTLGPAPPAAAAAAPYELGPPPPSAAAAHVPAPLTMAGGNSHAVAEAGAGASAVSPHALPDSPKNRDVFRFIHVDTASASGAGAAPAPAAAAGAVEHKTGGAMPGHTNCVVCNPSHRFCTNYVSTTKYNLLTFLPLNLFEQFRKKANFYFLFVAAISLTPLSPQTPFVSVAPLVFVLAVSAIKEAIEDYSRYKLDKQINESMVLAWRRSAWAQVMWQDLVVGDVLYVTADRAFPADLLLLKSSGQQGSCNIETSNLDGETNLKTKQAIPESYNIACSEDGKDYTSRLPSAVIESSGPDKSLASSAWKGNIAFAPTNEKLALGMDQLLLRGCTLRNTKWIVAVVVFTGADTKLVLNNKSSAFKRSNVDLIVDRALYVLFVLQALLCIGGAILNYLWLHDNAAKHWYLGYVSPKTVNLDEEAGLSVFTYVVLLNIMIPISLYVSMELVKFAQAYFISTDIEMYYPLTNTPARARTSNLNEELGQVHYIFSDKTGTLTGNIMQFLRCSVGGQSFGEDPLSPLQPEDLVPYPRPKGMPPANPNFPCKDNRMLRVLFSNAQPHSSLINEFFTQLVTNHTVYPEVPSLPAGQLFDPFTNNAKVVFQAESPDEKALIEAACENQYFFYHREPKAFKVGKLEINGTEIRVNVRGEPVVFEVLETLKFNSTRARMSAIVRDPRDNKIKIYCKGADSKIYARLTKASQERDWNATDQHLSEFAKKGLRTLCLAYREVPEAEFITWYEAHKVALATIDNREHHVTESQKRIENEFTLIGATAIEDQLQVGVPETIAKLAVAGIRIWVLTGDKVETAINIGKSCELLNQKMLHRGLMVVHVEESMKEDEARANVMRMLNELAPQVQNREEASDDLALVISGRALGFIFGLNKEEREAAQDLIKSGGGGGAGTAAATAELAKQLEAEHKTRLLFLSVAQKCKAVICCRVSPAQKAEVVSLVKDTVQGVITLAIGDGANDVPMIKSAHVGVGIAGLEGLQAVMASDYAIAQFRFLERLLLVHGAWSYRRTALLINYSFYKNMIISFLQVVFAFYCAFSGQLYYDPYAGSAYNIIFTSFPVLFLATFNRDVSAKNLLRYPELYKSGPANQHFGIGLLLLHLTEAILQSLALFFFAVLVFNDNSTSDGTVNDQWVGSTAMYSYLILMVNIRVGLDVRSWTWISVLFSILSVLAWFIFAVVYSALKITPNIYGVATRTFGQQIFWAGFVGLPVALLIPELVYRFVQRSIFPTPLDIVSELDYLEERKEAEQKSAASKGRANNAALLAVGGAAAPAEPQGKQHVMDKAAAAGALQRTGGSVGSAGSAGSAGGVALEPVGQPLNYPLLPPLHDTSSPASAVPAPAATASPAPAPGASSATYALALGGASPAPPTDNVVLASSDVKQP